MLPRTALIALAACAAAGCSPGDRGWCRAPADYTPGGAPVPVRAGALAVEADRGDVAGSFFAELLARDLSHAGYFSSASAGVPGSAPFTLRAGVPRLEYTGGESSCRLLSASAEIELIGDGKTLLSREYRRSWPPASAPACEEAWERELPGVMLEIRGDVIASAR